MNTSIQEQVKSAVKARRDSVKALRARIVELLDAVPIGAKLSDDKGLVVRVARVHTGASQWSNRTWDVIIRGAGYITADGKLLAEDIENSLFDGRNTHYRTCEGTRLGSGYSDDGEFTDLRNTTGAETRELAARLPEAIARYLDECALETAANLEAAEKLEKNEAV